MGDFPTDLIGWADEMDLSADRCREAGYPSAVEEGNRLLAKVLRQAAAENAALRERVAAIQVHAAEIAKERDYRDRTSNHDNYTDQHRSRVREARALERLLAAAKPAAQEGKETT